VRHSVAVSEDTHVCGPHATVVSFLCLDLCHCLLAFCL